MGYDVANPNLNVKGRSWSYLSESKEQKKNLGTVLSRNLFT